MEPGLQRCLFEMAKAMYTLIQERRNHIKSCITVKVSKGATRYLLSNIGSRVTFFSVDSGHNFLNALSVTMITKKIEPWKCGLARAQNLQESSKIFAKPKENFTLHWERWTLHLLNVRYYPQKRISFYGGLWIRVGTQVDPISHNLELWKELLFRFDTRKCHEFDLWSFWYSLPLTSQKTQG